MVVRPLNLRHTRKLGVSYREAEQRGYHQQDDPHGVDSDDTTVPKTKTKASLLKTELEGKRV